MASVPDFVRPYPGGWQDFSEGETPITAEILNGTYDDWLAAVSGWINGAEPRIERIPDELIELTGDVLITNPSDGQVLKYNATTHMWYNGTDETGSTVTFSQIQASGTKIATITIDGTSYDIYAPNGGGGGGDTVTWTQLQSTGTKIATITINGVSTDVYAPNGGSGGGDSVSYTQIVQSGTKIGTITINNVATDIYVPTVPTKTSDLTNDSNFVSDASYVHTDNNYTTTEKNKLGDLVQVVANPQSGTSAGDLSSISIGGTKYDIPSGGGGGTTVVANPSGEATVELEKLQVGSTIYSIPEGGSGGGLTKTTLYTLDGNTPESVVTLSDTIENYDLIEIVTLYGHEDQNDYKQNAIYNSDELIASIGTTRPINWHVGNDTAYTWIYVTDVDEFTIHVRSGQTGLGIWYVYGYKFNGGGGGYTEVTGTLTAGQTSIILSDVSITTSSTIDVYTDADIDYNSISVSTGSVTITFDAQGTNMGVKVRVS